MLIRTLTSGLCLLAAAPVAAQYIEAAPTAGWQLLQSDEFVEIADWPDLRDAILAAWSNVTPAQIGYADAPEVGSDAAGPAYFATGPGIEIISIFEAPADPDIFETLTTYFGDLDLGDTAAFSDGIVVEAIVLSPTATELAVYFMGKGGTQASPAQGAAGDLADTLLGLARNPQVITRVDEPPLAQILFELTSDGAIPYLESAALLLEGQGYTTSLFADNPEALLIQATRDEMTVLIQSGREASGAWVTITATSL